MHQIHNLLYLPASNLQEDVEIIIFPVAPRVYRNESACFQMHVHSNKWQLSPTHKALSSSDRALKDAAWAELKGI